MRTVRVAADVLVLQSAERVIIRIVPAPPQKKTNTNKTYNKKINKT